MLGDEQIVPDSQITVVLVRLPWIGAGPDQVKDLGGGEFVIEGDEKMPCLRVGPTLPPLHRLNFKSLVLDGFGTQEGQQMRRFVRGGLQQWHRVL